MKLVIFSALVLLAFMAHIHVVMANTERVKLTFRVSFFLDPKCYKKWAVFSNGEEDKVIPTINYVYSEVLFRAEEFFNAQLGEVYHFDLDLVEVFVDKEIPAKLVFLSQVLYRGEKLVFDLAYSEFRNYLNDNAENLQSFDLAFLVSCFESVIPNMFCWSMDDFVSNTNLAAVMFDSGLHKNVDSVVQEITIALGGVRLKADIYCGEKKKKLQDGKISDCVKNSIHETIQSMIASNDDYSILSNTTTGEKVCPLPFQYSVGQQCQMLYGPGSLGCNNGEQNNVCEKLKCTDTDGSCLQRNNDRAFDGTNCGEEKLCANMRCA